MFAKNAWIGFTKCRLLLMRIEEERMVAIRSHKNILTEKIESIDYTHLLGYPSEVVAAEVMSMVKDVVSDYMDEVIEQLETVATSYTARANAAKGVQCNYNLAVAFGTEKAIEIVKGGGIDG